MNKAHEWMTRLRTLASAAGSGGGRGMATAESPEMRPMEHPDERRLQCLWYDGRIRPSGLCTVQGEFVEVEHPGEWNLQAGPDFLGASLRIGEDRRPLRGDVEAHLRPRDWIGHGHTGDPRYRGVVAHVCWSAGTLPDGTLPAGAVEICLGAAWRANPRCALEEVDIAAYPWSAPAPPSPCAQALSGWPPEARECLLSLAGEERLLRKAARLHALALERGEDQAVYEELLAGLGYSANKIPARRLAGRLPWGELHARAAGNADTAYALLLGTGGLLPDEGGGHPDPTAQPYVAALHRAWWKHAGLMEAQRMNPDEWRLAPLRPLNHPLRRLRAAAEWAAHEPHPAARLRAMAAGRSPADAVTAWIRWLDAPPDAFWSGRIGWNRARVRERGPNLVGAGRARALVINTVVPLMAASGMPAPHWRALLDALPGEEMSLPLREAGRALLGADHPPSLYRSGLRRQGLLDILQNCCLRQRSPCDACPLLARLAGLESRMFEDAATSSPTRTSQCPGGA